MRRSGVFVAAVFASVTAHEHPARACAPAPHADEVVSIADESAIIGWDPDQKIEHFIRRATFKTKAKDFGFLVPTPSKPSLSAVKDAVFDDLENAIRPAVVWKDETNVEPMLFCAAMFFARKSGVAMDEAAAPVRILDSQRVAGFDAVVLEADSAGALSDWLKQHGYSERAELTEWLKPYVAMHWKITAFKIALDNTTNVIDGVGLSTEAVDMTFTTDRPFFPYREPSNQREEVKGEPRAALIAQGSRKLRVFFFGPARVTGTIGDGSTKWLGTTSWANAYTNASLPFATKPGTWMTALDDEASPRPGVDDLFFGPSVATGAVVPEPITRYHTRTIPLPLELPILLVIGGALYFYRKRSGDHKV